MKHAKGHVDLNRRIAEALINLTLTFVDEDGTTYIYRDGDDLEDVAFDVLSDYQHNLNATAAALPKDLELRVCWYGGETYHALLMPLVQPDDMKIQFWAGYGEDYAEAAANALLVYLTYKGEKP